MKFLATPLVGWVRFQSDDECGQLTRNIASSCHLHRAVSTHTPTAFHYIATPGYYARSVPQVESSRIIAIIRAPLKLRPLGAAVFRCVVLL